jgi:hypothetical protein
MVEIEFPTTVEVNEVEVEVYVTAEFHPATPQTAVDNTGTPQAVFLVTVTDERSKDVLQFLGDIEREILKVEVLEHV